MFFPRGWKQRFPTAINSLHAMILIFHLNPLTLDIACPPQGTEASRSAWKGGGIRLITAVQSGTDSFSERTRACGQSQGSRKTFKRQLLLFETCHFSTLQLCLPRSKYSSSLCVCTWLHQCCSSLLRESADNDL